MTNLQMIIVKRIIEDEAINKAMVIYIGDTNSEKVKHYLHELEKVTIKCIAIEEPRLSGCFKTIRKSFIAKKIINRLGVKHFSTVYLANIKKSFIHHILSQVTFSNLMTFDDGIGNLNRESSLYNLYPQKKWKKKIHQYFGRTIHSYDIISKSELHYTIFENRNNLISNTKYISLVINYNHTLYSGPEKVIKVLLGTVYKQESKNKDDTQCLIDSVQKLINEESIDIYIPHPRDENVYFPGIKTISSNKIAEEEIIALLNQHYTVEIYGFANTTQFNLSSIKNVRNYALQSHYLKESHHFKITKLCDESFKIITL